MSCFIIILKSVRSSSVSSPVQLDDFEAYVKDMSKDSAYKFSLQFEVRTFNKKSVCRM